MSNTIGKIFRLTTFGESHGAAIGGVIDGFPSNIEIDFDFIQNELNKRKPGFEKIVSQRNESDLVKILSGIFEKKSTGTSIGFVIENNDAKYFDYENIKNIFRPGHADFTYFKKYKNFDFRGGGRSSARETANWVVAGAFAKLLLQRLNIKIQAFTSQIGNIKLNKDYKELDLETVFDYSTRCPDLSKHTEMLNLINEVKKKTDSVGGIVSCVVKNMPIGLGEPIFDKFHANLGKAILSINACKGFEIGQGFNSASMFGSQNNDQMNISAKGSSFLSNNAGGVLGGITTGQDLFFRAAFKPTPSISFKQQTIDNQNNVCEIQIKGRHDTCVVPRAVSVIEAMTAITLVDAILIANSSRIFS